MDRPAKCGSARHPSGQYSRAGLSTSTCRRSAGVSQTAMIQSTSAPSSGMWDFMFGCGQSVPQSVRSGAMRRSSRATGATSA